MLDDSGGRRLPSPISPSDVIENTYSLCWRPGGMDLFNMDSVDCGHSVLERCSSVCDCIQSMHPCILWAAKGVIRYVSHVECCE